MGKRIYIIEDSPELIDLLTEALSHEGFDVFSQDTGRQAVAKIKEAKPDLILLDVMLPGLDGHAIAGQLSADDATKSIPIIVLTALGQAKSMFDKFPQVRGFNLKPFTTEELLTSIKTALQV
jgi:DNA-binding response OmpR family regulator